MFIKQFNFHWGNYLMVSFMGLSFGLIISACSSGKDDGVALEKFSVTNPIIKDTVYINEYVADIHAIQNIEIRAKTDGYLEIVHFDEGQFVRAGQLLFSVSGKQYTQELLMAQAALTSAKAYARAAEVEFKNVKTLVGKNIVSQSELDLAEAKYDAAIAKVEEARALEGRAILRLSMAQIKAPFDGFINRIPSKAGSLIAEGTLLTSLSNNREVYVYFNVSENEYLEYASHKISDKEKAVTLILNNGEVHPHQGKIEIIEGQIDKATGNIAFRAKFPNPDGILKHGSSGKVQVKTDLMKAMLIPQKSTFEIQENIYVFVVTSDNIVQQRKVIPIARLPHLYVIEQTLTANEKIIYEGVQKVKDGDKVITETVSFSQITNSKN